jgi:hypothetical protein
MFGLLIAGFPACSGLLLWQKRALDPQPSPRPLATPLPAGRVEALFVLETGGDQMRRGRVEAGLAFVVRYGSQEFWQTIASCREPARGSVLGGGTERELEIARCGGEYWLLSEPGVVTVRRGDPMEGAVVTRLILPEPSMRAVSPASR